MAGGDDDYGDAFKKAKLEHDRQLGSPTEAKRLQAEADADIAVLSDVVLPQLQAAAQKLHPLGGNVEIRQYGRTGKTLRPASVAFRITDQQDQQDQSGNGKGHQSRAYLIVPRGGMVTVTCGDSFDVTGQPKQPKNVSEEIGIQRRDDVTIENVKKLIMRAIEEYRNDRDPPGARITTITWNNVKAGVTVVRPSLTLAAVAENAGVNMAEYSDVLNRPVRLPVAMLVLCCHTPRNRDVRYTPASDRMAEWKPPLNAKRGLMHCGIWRRLVRRLLAKLEPDFLDEEHEEEKRSFARRDKKKGPE